MNVWGGDLAGRGPKYVITIGQLAGYAGVTIKAVRHYHERGLLAEPPRDASGYRRYSAEQAIELVKIKTLADAGVPLARIKELLAAGPDEVARAVADIDRTLAERADTIRRTRERIAGLAAGNRLFVSAETADFLDRLRATGVSERGIRMERDLWILMQSASPAQAAIWLADKLEAMADPEFQALYLEYDAAFDWPADDPRLEALADRSQRWMRTRQPTGGQLASPEDAAIARFIATSAAPWSPAWDRLAEIARERATRAAADATPRPG
jgi:DNA-binding transcriptional MerR regulator